MTTAHAYERLVAANPITDPERYVAESLDLEASLRELESALFDEPGGRSRARAHQYPPGRRWLIAAATFGLVLLVGVAGLVPKLGTGEVVGRDPQTVVEAFFERWNKGDAGAAMALVSPDVSLNGGLQSANDLRALMDWELEFVGDMEVTCRSGDIADVVMCDWKWRTAGTTALGLEATEHTFIVTDGLIAAFGTPNYGALERSLVEYAKAADPDGYAAECDRRGQPVISGTGFPYNARCGAFLAGVESDYVESLAG